MKTIDRMAWCALGLALVGAGPAMAEDFTWRIFEKVTLTHKAEFFPNLEEDGEWRARFEATLSFPLVKNFTLNFQVIDIYDTDPARNVDKNELQFRSSIGVNF